ncbi:MAG TPA: AAA family ATPase [Sulfurovum sp. UBA12169]|nr:MAG TPA: AAA family ATPase [Sulfurovum sp. UBA12169]
MTARQSIEILQQKMNEAIIGQERIVERFIIGLLADGNILVEGLPGLAKTKTVRTMAEIIDSKFSRIQFTPDLVPSDIIGVENMYEENGAHKFRFEPGPIFGNIILADEINRAPAKVQSAMLEAMEERQVTVAGKTYKLPKLFIVMATQNPLEEEGTYRLPEAQKDRFLMHVNISYVDMESEFKIIQQAHERKNANKLLEANKEKIPQEMIFAARDEIEKVKMSDDIERYIVELVFATRYPLRYSKQLDIMIDVGVSPRASLALDQCTRVIAWMRGRDYTTVEDVQAVIHDVFRHRLIKSGNSSFDDNSNDDIIDIILKQVPLPA